MTTYIPWKLLMIGAVAAGIFWPAPYFVSPAVGLFFTIFLAGATGLFIITLPPTGEVLPFGQYLVSGFLTGAIAIGMAVITINFFCHLDFLAHNHMCTARAGIGGFVVVAYGLYLFILLMLYLFMR